MWPTIVTGTIITAIFVAIILFAVRNKIKGKHICSCGGSCSGCGMNDCCHQSKADLPPAQIETRPTTQKAKKGGQST